MVLSLFVWLFVWRLYAHNAAKVLEINGRTMGTRYTVQLPKSGQLPDTTMLISRIKQRLLAIENDMSTWRRDSQLSRFNRLHNTQWFPVSAELAAVVAAAKSLYRQSDGWFDASIGPLVNLWGFGPVNGFTHRPHAAQIMRAKARLGMSSVQVHLGESPALRKTLSDLYLDLSAIAKGYAVDQIALLLDGMGISSYLVEIGGEVRVLGFNARGQPWQLAVEKPLSTGQIAQLVFPLQQGAVATSGSYRNVREQDGQRFSHAINPFSGKPVEHNLLSVTVLERSAMWADGIATALLVMGPEKGVRWAVEHQLDALFILAPDGQTVLRTTGRFTGWVGEKTNP